MLKDEHANFMMPHDFQTPSIIFGLGAISEIKRVTKQFPGKRSLIVTDEVIEETGLAERIRRMLEEERSKVDVFNKVEPEPGLANADLVAEVTRDGDYDFVVGVGGGSVLDMAKVASIASTNICSVREFIGVDMVEKPGIPKILIPTTSGTGSEVTNVTIISLGADQIKSAIVSPKLLADIALVDPMVTVTMPSKVTASTGIDALSHAIEAMMSKESFPITDSLALDAISRIWKNLRIACHQAMNIEARYNMSLAALLAGLAFGNVGVCGGHSLAYAYATKYGLSHGVSCGIALPYIMQYNLPFCEGKVALISSIIGGEISGQNSQKSANRLAVKVRELIGEVGLPTSLKALGIPARDVAGLAENVLKSRRLLARQPRKILKDDAMNLMQAIYEGAL